MPFDFSKLIPVKQTFGNDTPSNAQVGPLTDEENTNLNKYYDALKLSQGLPVSQKPQENVLQPKDDIFAAVGQKIKEKLPEETEAPVIKTSQPKLGRPSAPATPIAPSATPETKKPQDILQSIFGNELNDAALREAQVDRNKQQALLQLAKAGLQIAGGGLKTKIDDTNIDEQQKMAERKVDDLMQRRRAKVEEMNAQSEAYRLSSEKDRNDPNSPVSKMIQSVAGKMLSQAGMDPKTVEGMSTASIEKVLPPIERYFQNMITKQAMQQQKTDKKQNEDFTKLGESLTLSRLTGSAVQQAKAKKFAAERLEGLLKQFPDGNIPTIQTRELATSLGALLSAGSGSGAAVTQINELVPHTMRGDATKIASWFTGKPMGAQQQAFIKQYAETVGREKDIADNQLKEAKMEKALAYGHLGKQNPETFYSMLGAHQISEDEFNKFKSGKRLDITGGKGKFLGEEDKTAQRDLTSEAKPAKMVTKKMYSPSANKTKFIYADGSEEIKDGKL